MAEDSRKLFVAGLPDSITEDVLRQLFEATGGNVVEVSLPKDRATGRPRGFGFVTLATIEEANSARESLDGSFQGGKSISVRPFQAEPPRRDGAARMGDRRPRPAARPPGGPPAAAWAAGMGGPAGAPDRTLYVGNLPYDATVEEVEALIGATGAGPVVRVHLPMDPDGRKRGFGFVTMASAEPRRARSKRSSGADIRGRRLVVNLAHPKGERPAGEGRGRRLRRRRRWRLRRRWRWRRRRWRRWRLRRRRRWPAVAPARPRPARKTFDERRRRGAARRRGTVPARAPAAAASGGATATNWDKNATTTGTTSWQSRPTTLPNGASRDHGSLR